MGCKKRKNRDNISTKMIRTGTANALGVKITDAVGGPTAAFGISGTLVTIQGSRNVLKALKKLK